MLVSLWQYWNRETLHVQCIEIDIEQNFLQKKLNFGLYGKKVPRNPFVKINSLLTKAMDYFNVSNCKILLFNLFTVPRPSVAKTK